MLARGARIRAREGERTRIARSPSCRGRLGGARMRVQNCEGERLRGHCCGGSGVRRRGQHLSFDAGNGLRVCSRPLGFTVVPNARAWVVQSATSEKSVAAFIVRGAVAGGEKVVEGESAKRRRCAGERRSVGQSGEFKVGQVGASGERGRRASEVKAEKKIGRAHV